ncbi:MAG: TIGR00270 family protein [Candidatus Diapherotrites archaeon]|nr:TIGR00270 family protein [Candidatus Diapherotrites archaeon]
MICELCGKEVDSGKKVSIEGATIDVCAACARHGTVIGSAGRAPVLPRRPAYRKELKQLDVVDDYDAIVHSERERRGWKQEDLAQKVSEQVSTIRHIESGSMEPTEATARKLERVLGVKLLQEVANTAVELPAAKSSAKPTLGDVVQIRRRK